MTQFSILLALNLTALVLIFLYVRRRVRKALELDGLLEKLREEVGALVRDLNQTADRNITLAEEAIRALRAATEEADRTVVARKREAERRSVENAVYDRMGKMRESVPRPSIRETSSSGATIARTSAVAPESVSNAEEQRREPTAGPTGTTPGFSRAAPQDAIPFVTFSSTPIRPKPPVKEEVLDLTRRGISSEFIAAKLGITVAEVELIVSLEEQKGFLSRGEES